MAWVKVKGMNAVLYVPERQEEGRKHSCPDCDFCQVCSDLRCSLCLKKAGCAQAEKKPAPRCSGKCARRGARGK